VGHRHRGGTRAAERQIDQSRDNDRADDKSPGRPASAALHDHPCEWRPANSENSVPTAASIKATAAENQQHDEYDQKRIAIHVSLLADPSQRQASAATLAHSSQTPPKREGSAFASIDYARRENRSSSRYMATYTAKNAVAATAANSIRNNGSRNWRMRR